MEIRRAERGTAGYPLIETVEPLTFGVIKLLFDDGYEAVLDLRPLMKRSIWRNIRSKEDFFAIRIEKHGAHLSWPRSNGDAEPPG